MKRSTVLQAISAARACADALREGDAATTTAEQRRARRKYREAGRRLKVACVAAAAQDADTDHPIPWIREFRKEQT